jgi:hypothetical protein
VPPLPQEQPLLPEVVAELAETAEDVFQIPIILLVHLNIPAMPGREYVP